MSPVALLSGGLVFQLVCCFHRYWACSSKSTVQPKKESCFQGRAILSVSSFNLSPFVGTALNHRELTALVSGHCADTKSR